MKKVYAFTVILILLVIANSAMAQNYTITPSKTISRSMGSSSTFNETIYVNNNTSTDLDIRWKLLENTFNDDQWNTTGIFCDNELCYLSIPDSADNVVPADSNAIFKLATDAVNDITVTSIFKIYIYEIGNYHGGDTLTFVASPPVGISGENADELLNIYPNPAVNTLTLNLNTPANTTAIVYNMQGKQVLTAAFNGSEKPVLDIAGLAAGNYLIKLSDTNGITIANKVFQKVD